VDCLFCKIAEGAIPSKKVFENEDVVAFYDIAPQAPFHAVIIPRAHIASAAEITKDNSALVARVFEAAAVIAAQQGLSDGFRIVTNCGEKAGQTVGHLHFHLLAGRDMAWPPG
jgi:histidine triad (HIT) family protein